jgi:hypothetical protein
MGPTTSLSSSFSNVKPPLPLITTGRKAATLIPPNSSMKEGFFNKQNVLAGCVFIDLFAVSLIVPLLPMRCVPSYFIKIVYNIVIAFLKIKIGSKNSE